MAKKGSVPKGAVKAFAASGSAAGEGSAAEALAGPAKLNLYDAAGLRAALDDCARDVILNAGYDEDVSISNVKILAGLVAIALALYAQFGPGKFPGTWWTVLGCVISYSVITVLLQLYSWHAEGDAFLVTLPRKGHAQGVRLSSGMDVLKHEYSMQLSEGAPSKSGCSAARTISFPSFFHEDGYLADSAFREEVAALLEELEGSASKKTK